MAGADRDASAGAAGRFVGAGRGRWGGRGAGALLIR